MRIFIYFLLSINFHFNFSDTIYDLYDLIKINNKNNSKQKLKN